MAIRRSSPSTISSDRDCAQLGLPLGTDPAPQSRTDGDSEGISDIARRDAPVNPADICTVRFDRQGRVGLRPVSNVLGWGAGERVELSFDNDVLIARAVGEGIQGPVARIDARLRLQVPYGLRQLSGLQPDSNVVLVAMGSLVAIVPARRILDALIA